MKYILKKSIILVLTFVFLILLFKDPSISKESIAKSFSLWTNNLVPSLFPMIIINEILINYNFPSVICSIFYKPFNKIFKLSYNGTYLFIMSIFIGTPANAILLKNMLDKKMVQIEEINKLLYVCYFSNPLFLYNMLSLIFSNKRVVLFLLFSHYLANFITLFLIRNKYQSNTDNRIKIESISLSKLLPSAIKKAFNSLVVVLGVVSFYLLISDYFLNSTIFKGMLEITTGLNSLIINQSSSKKILAIIIINFGGLSIFTQIKSILEDTNLNFINYFKGRILQIIISLLLCSTI